MQQSAAQNSAKNLTAALDASNSHRDSCEIEGQVLCTSDFRLLFLRQRKRQSFLAKLIEEGKGPQVETLPSVSLQGWCGVVGLEHWHLVRLS